MHSIPVEFLLTAYRSGVFPMAEGRDDDQLFWIEPRERAILPLDGFRCSRSLAKVLRQERFEITCNKDFAAVIEECAAPRADHPESWISQRIAASYCDLHRAGHAHSLECWYAGRLVGGLYGVAFDRVFCGESMFSRMPNASKVALAWLIALLRRSGTVLLDCQFMTDHLASLGAITVERNEYQNLLADAANGPPAMPLTQSYASLLAEAEASSSSPGKVIAQSLTQTS